MTAKEKSYGFIGVDMPRDVSLRLALMQRAIPKEDLYEDKAGYGLEKNPHVTLAYGHEENDPRTTKEALADLAAGEGTISGLSSFDQQDYKVLKFDVDSEHLHSLNKRLRERIPMPGNTFPDYKPHVTVAYMKPDVDLAKYQKLARLLSGRKFPIRHLDFRGPDDKRTTLTLADLQKEAAVPAVLKRLSSALVSKAGDTTGAAKNLMRGAQEKAPSAYKAAKRYLARNPVTADALPQGAKKVKRKGDTVMSYIDPKTKYRHTKEAPSLLTTIGSSATSSPRVARNPTIDRWIKRIYLGSLAGSAAKKGHEANKERLRYDGEVQSEANKLRGKGRNTLADIVEQGKSGNMVKRIMGINKYKIPASHLLAPLNTLATPVARSGLKEALIAGLHRLVGSERPVSRPKLLFKPPVVSSGIIPRTIRSFLGKPRTPVESMQTVLRESITPQKEVELAKTPKGRILLEVMNRAKTANPETIEEGVNIAQDQWEKTRAAIRRLKERQLQR